MKNLNADKVGSQPKAIILAAIFLVAFVVAGLLGILRFIENERDRIMLNWQTQLGIIADTRADAVSGWVGHHISELKKVTTNVAVQPYFEDLLAAAPNSAPLAQADYLRIFLMVSASSAGFAGTLAGPDVAINIEKPGSAGIALLDLNGKPVVGTKTMPPIEGRLEAFLANLNANSVNVLDLYKNSQNNPSMAFSVPIMASDGAKRAQTGWVLGVKEVSDELIPLMRQPGNIWRSAESLLVREAGSQIEYLTPRKKAGREKSHFLQGDTPALAGAFAVKQPSGFGIFMDYNGDKVVVSTRKINQVPWSLIYKVDYQEVLGPSEDRLNRMMVMFLLIVALITAFIILIWRHAADRRTKRALEENRALVDELDAHNILLRQITDSQHRPIYIVDEEGTYQFANQTAAKTVAMTAESLPGKTLQNVLGNAAANRLVLGINETIERDGVAVHIQENGEGDTKQVKKTEFIIIAPQFPGKKSILIVEEDISEFVRIQERQERILEGVLRLLVNIIDLRDPDCAGHSSRVAKVAKEIAEEMGLSETEIQAVTMAGLLMNFGKALVPQQLLTKSGKLTDQEYKQIQESSQRFINFLEGLEFDGAVIESLRQVDEKSDGSGPEGIEGDDILVTAQIIAVANAFVAMTSSRAYREKIDVDTAIGLIIANADTRNSRRVSSALVHLLDNRDAWERWKTA